MTNISPKFCFYCGKKTEIIKKDIKKSVCDKMISVKNVPLHCCRDCREIFYPDSVIIVLNKLPDRKLNKNEYMYEEIADK